MKPLIRAVTVLASVTLLVCATLGFAFAGDPDKPRRLFSGEHWRDVSVVLKVPDQVQIRAEVWNKDVRVTAYIVDKAGKPMLGHAGGKYGASFANAAGKSTVTFFTKDIPPEASVKIQVTGKRAFAFHGELLLPIPPEGFDAIKQPLVVELQPGDGVEKPVVAKFQLISGTTGKPVPKRELALCDDGPDRVAYVLARATTDEEGLFSFPLHKGAKYRIKSRDPDTQDEPLSPFPVTAESVGKEPLTICTKRLDATIRFVVREGKAERAMKEAKGGVTLRGKADKPFRSPDGRTIITETEVIRFLEPIDGVLQLHDLRPGKYSIELNPAVKAYGGYVVDQNTFRVKENGEPQELVLRFRRAMPSKVGDFRWVTWGVVVLIALAIGAALLAKGFRDRYLKELARNKASG